MMGLAAALAVSDGLGRISRRSSCDKLRMNGYPGGGLLRRRATGRRAIPAGGVGGGLDGGNPPNPPFAKGGAFLWLLEHPLFRHSRESRNPRPVMQQRLVVGRRWPGFWIPACAGMTVGGGGGNGVSAPIPSFPRKRESTPRLATTALVVGRRLPGFWIPAYAGMTVGGAARLLVGIGVWIPAFAGMTIGMAAGWHIMAPGEGVAECGGRGVV